MDLTGKRIAVTGATGFLGRYLVRTLSARGAVPVAVVRNPSKVPTLATVAELAKADLADRDALRRAFAGCDAVCANAGVVGLGGTSRQTLIAANVDGTENVLRAAADAGVRRIVYTSSGVVYRDRRDHRYHEDHELRDAGDFATRFGWYGISKAVAERTAWKLAAELDLHLSTARPWAIHGAFDPHGPTHWIKKLMQAPLGFWVTHMEFPSVYAGDFSDAVARMIERPASIGRAYNIAGEEEGMGFAPILDAWSAAGGRTPRLVLRFPVPLRRRFDLTRAKADLGWTNRPLVDGLRETLALEAAEAP